MKTETPIECEICGNEVPEDEAHITDDGCWLCPDCYYDALYDEEI